jgi:hypothetical protein
MIVALGTPTLKGAGLRAREYQIIDRAPIGLACRGSLPARPASTATSPCIRISTWASDLVQRSGRRGEKIRIRRFADTRIPWLPRKNPPNSCAAPPAVNL